MQTLLTSKNLDHLGLVSGMCDRLEIASEIDRLLPNVNGLHQVSTGTCVKALILNGLGFSERRLWDGKLITSLSSKIGTLYFFMKIALYSRKIT